MCILTKLTIVLALAAVNTMLLKENTCLSLIDRFHINQEEVLDGIVSSTVLARRMGLSARWGSSCGMPFHAKEFFERNIQWKQQAPYVIDRLYQPWTVFTCAKRRNIKTSKHKRGKNKGTRRKKSISQF